MSEREQAVEQIRTLARRHNLSLADIATALSADDAQPDRSRVLVRLLSYLGGTFVFAGIGTFIGMNWDVFNSPTRVIMTLGPALTAFVLGWLACGDDRFRIAATPLFIIAATLMPTAMLVAMAEYGSGGDERIAWIVASGITSLQFLLAFLPLRRTALLFFVVFFAYASLLTLLDVLGLDGEWIAIVGGGSLVLLTIQVHRSVHAVTSPMGFVVGAWMFLWGLFDMVENTAFELLFVLASCLLIWAGIVVRSRTLNAAAVVALTAYTAWFTREYFADSFGWPLALIVFGLVLIALSAIGIRIDRRYLRD